VAKKAKAAVAEVDYDDIEEGEVPAGQLGDWKEVLPKEVQDAVDEYVECMRETNEARGRKNAARDKCIEMMEAHEIERVPIDDGGKFLVCESVQKLKTEKIKHPKEDE